MLRHEPGAIGLQLDGAGWTRIDELLARCRASGKHISREMLEEVVATSPKRRFAISDDGERIRANQGHTVDVDLGYEAIVPPDVLFHGTTVKSIASVREHGLKPMGRHHVHLSLDEETAVAVGARRGRPVVLRIFARKMHDDGYAFFRADNGVWMTGEVPPVYLDFSPPA